MSGNVKKYTVPFVAFSIAFVYSVRGARLYTGPFDAPRNNPYDERGGNLSVTTLAGSAGNQGNDDGTGAGASFNKPTGIATDGTYLYVADMYNNSIRKIVISTGVVTTLVTGFSSPEGITMYGANLYVADTSHCTIEQIDISTGAVTILAGTVGKYGSTDNTGPAASFGYPTGIATDGKNLYVTDTNNHTIREIVISTGAVTTLAGTAGEYGSTDDTGPAARFK